MRNEGPLTAKTGRSRGASLGQDLPQATKQKETRKPAPTKTPRKCTELGRAASKFRCRRENEDFYPSGIGEKHWNSSDCPSCRLFDPKSPGGQCAYRDRVCSLRIDRRYRPPEQGTSSETSVPIRATTVLANLSWDLGHLSSPLSSGKWRVLTPTCRWEERPLWVTSGPSG